MVKGCQRKTLHIKDTGSKYYEEAYLILRPGVYEGERDSVDMIDEAMRIVGESLSCEVPVKSVRTSMRCALFFCAGSTVGALITCIVWLFMNIVQ